MSREGWHTLTEIDPSAGTATCAVCGPVAPIFYRAHKSQWACQTHRMAINRARKRRNYKAGNYGHRTPQTRDSYLRYRYGIGVAEYEALMDSQGGKCAICEIPAGVGRRMAVDHDHETGRIRGLLCIRCNTGLGALGDDEQSVIRALAYLRRAN